MFYQITFQQLATFFAVAERLNVSETADALFTSQSALSKTISRLEASMGIKLFERNNRGLTLTAEGAYLFNKIRPLYNGISGHIEHARNTQRARQQIIRIGYPSTYDSSEDYDKLKQLINDYSAQHPEIELNEMLYDFEELKHALTFGEVDVAFAHGFILNGVDNISVKKVCRSSLCLAMSAQHRLAAAESFAEIDINEFNQESFYTIFHDDEASIKRAISSRLNMYGIAPKNVRFVQNFQSLIRILRQGKGMSICGYFSKATGHEDIKFFELPEMNDPPFLAAAWRTNDISKEAMRFISILPDDMEGMTVFENEA